MTTPTPSSTPAPAQALADRPNGQPIGQDPLIERARELHIIHNAKMILFDRENDELAKDPVHATNRSRAYSAQERRKLREQLDKEGIPFEESVTALTALNAEALSDTTLLKLYTQLLQRDASDLLPQDRIDGADGADGADRADTVDGTNS